MVHEACDTSGNTASMSPGGNPGKIIQIVLNFFFMEFKKTDGIKSPVNRSGVEIPAELLKLIQTLV
jgi:hypothetical protein